jgi:hypothetical protein
MHCENWRHYGSDAVAVENHDGMMIAACRMCVEEQTTFKRNLGVKTVGVEVDFKVWGPAEKMAQRTIFNRWFSELLFQDGSSCLLRDVLRNQKENLWGEWQRVKPYHEQTEEIPIPPVAVVIPTPVHIGPVEVEPEVIVDPDPNDPAVTGGGIEITIPFDEKKPKGKKP